MPTDHHGSWQPRSTPELMLHAPPTCPDVANRTGPQRPRSGPAAMDGYNHREHTGAAAASTCHPPAAPNPATPLGTTTAAQADGPHDRRRQADGIGEAPPPSSAARALLGHVLRWRRRGEREGGGRPRQRLGLSLLCRPSGGDMGGREGIYS
jgi:hypothetical protein